MRTLTLEVEDSIIDKFLWFLNHFSDNEVKVLEDNISDDKYLRGIDGMVESIVKAKNEPIENGVTLENLDW